MGKASIIEAGEGRVKVKAYPAERKEALLRRMMPPENKIVSELARETGITEQTLYAWRRQLKNQGVAVPGDGKNAGEWTSQHKFAVVLESTALDAADEKLEVGRGSLAQSETDSIRRTKASSVRSRERYIDKHRNFKSVAVLGVQASVPAAGTEACTPKNSD